MEDINSFEINNGIITTSNEWLVTRTPNKSLAKSKRSCDSLGNLAAPIHKRQHISLSPQPVVVSDYKSKDNHLFVVDHGHSRHSMDPIPHKGIVPPPNSPLQLSVTKSCNKMVTCRKIMVKHETPQQQPSVEKLCTRRSLYPTTRASLRPMPIEMDNVSVDCRPSENSSMNACSNSMPPTTILATVKLHDGSRLSVVSANEEQHSVAMNIKVPFPVIVHRMINKCHEENPSVMRWEHGGSAFSVFTAHPNLSSILALYFAHANFSSFQRQLNSYGWKKCLKGKYAGMYFNDRFHRNNAFQELCQILRGYKTTMPGCEDPNRKAMKKTTCSKDKEHRDCIFSTVPSAESLNMLRCSNQDHLSDSIVHFRPIFGRQSCGRWARNEESMTTQTNSVSAKEHVVRTPYSANAFIGATRPVGRHVESQEQYESYLVTKGIPATIVSQFSEDTPMKMTSHGSPSMMTHPATPSWFLLGSQISCSNSHDWGCSPPVGIAMRQDILRGLTPIVESLEASFTATGQLQELLIPKEAKHTCMDGGEKGIPVQVLFHGNYAEVSPILPKIPRFSPSPFQKELLFSQTSNSTYCASTRAEIESADLLL